jgi:hypothetical protein
MSLKIERTISSEFPSNGCNLCKKVDDSTMQKCSRCRSVIYCGELCQKADWDKHEVFCNKTVFTKTVERIAKEGAAAEKASDSIVTQILSNTDIYPSLKKGKNVRKNLDTLEENIKISLEQLQLLGKFLQKQKKALEIAKGLIS